MDTTKTDALRRKVMVRGLLADRQTAVKRGRTKGLRRPAGLCATRRGYCAQPSGLVRAVETCHYLERFTSNVFDFDGQLVVDGDTRLPTAHEIFFVLVPGETVNRPILVRLTVFVYRTNADPGLS